MSSDSDNRQLILEHIPEGDATPDHFGVRIAPMPSPEDGQVLVQSHYLSVDAALRLIIRDSDEFLFRVRPGDLIHGSVAGRVIESRSSQFNVGDYVTGSLGMQEYAVANPDQLERCDLDLAPLSSWLGGMGVSGLTAYFALIETCRPQPGQTILVNGAAGAVGSIAGQIARLAGARVIGVTSSDEKCQWLTDTLGYDAALNYQSPGWQDRLRDVAPERLDVVFDNVGGDVLDACLPWINLRGTVLLCGSTSQYGEAEMRGPANYIWLGTMRARLQGFVVFDFEDQYDKARRHMRTWVQDGKLILPEYIIDGTIADYPSAFAAMYAGANLGKTLVRLPVAQA